MIAWGCIVGGLTVATGYWTSVAVQVVMQTGLELTGDAGFQYIRLIDA